MQTPLIKLDNVDKIYKIENIETYALRDFNLRINKGDFIAIMGPSGSGKSTAMNLIGSLDDPTNGKVYLDNNDISLLSDSDLSQIRGKKIGFIFQSFNLIPSLTALENVMLPMIFQKTSKEFRVENAKRLLGKVGLSARLSNKPNELSGGEKQRVAIARALANDPEIILADEPTGNLDSKTGQEIIKLLSSLNNEGKTVILITHNQEIAKKAKKIIKIKDGMII